MRASGYIFPFLLFLLFCIRPAVLAQLPAAPKSVTNTEASASQQVQQKESLFKKLTQKISQAKKKAVPPKVKLPSTEAHNQKRVLQVYGWHPYWISDAHFNYDYNLLTTLSYYACDMKLNPAGETEYILNGWDSPATTEMINLARADGCRIELTLRCQDQETLRNVLNDPEEQSSCISMLLNMITMEQKADGVTIAFENIPTGNEVQLTKFLTAFSDSLTAKGKTLSLTLPARDASDSYQLPQLAPHINQFIIAAYNYNGKKSDQPGPVAPLQSSQHWDPHDIKRSVAAYADAGVPKTKMILALPYHGAVWQVDSSGKGKPKYRFRDNPRYNRVVDHAEKHPQSIRYDTVSHSNYYYFREKGKTYVCFYDNGRSLKEKYEWVAQEGLAGTGIWALGYDDGRPELWNALGNKINVLKMDSALGKPTALSDSTEINKVPGSAGAAAATAGAAGTSVTGAGGGGTEASRDSTAAAPTVIGEMKSVAENPKVLTTIILTLAVFCVIGLLCSLGYESVREKLLITEFTIYLLAQGLLALLFLSLYSIISFLRDDPSLAEIIDPARFLVWLTWITVFLSMLINILSYKLFLDQVRRGRLP